MDNSWLSYDMSVHKACKRLDMAAALEPNKIIEKGKELQPLKSWGDMHQIVAGLPKR